MAGYIVIDLAINRSVWRRTRAQSIIRSVFLLCPLIKQNLRLITHHAVAVLASKNRRPKLKSEYKSLHSPSMKEPLSCQCVSQLAIPSKSKTNTSIYSPLYSLQIYHDNYFIIFKLFLIWLFGAVNVSCIESSLLEKKNTKNKCRKWDSILSSFYQVIPSLSFK